MKYQHQQQTTHEVSTQQQMTNEVAMQQQTTHDVLMQQPITHKTTQSGDTAVMQSTIDSEDLY